MTATKLNTRRKKEVPQTLDQVKNCSNGVGHQCRVKVGPFEVLIRNKQHYRLYTVDLEGVNITKQMSYPSVGGILDDLKQAANAGHVSRRCADKWIKLAGPAFNDELKLIGEQIRESSKRPQIIRDRWYR